jgi:phosphatidyl-myo-inositol dimannoside synthase
MNTSGKAARIGLVAPYFPPQIGGANIYCYALAKAIASKGHDVHVFAHREAVEDPAFTLHPILTTDLRPDLGRLVGFEMDVWHSLFFFYAPLAFHKPNVFVTGHGDDFFSLRIRYPLPGRRLLAGRVLWRIGERARDKAEHLLQKAEMAMNRTVYARAVRRARQIIAVSNFSRARFCDAFPAASAKTTVIPPGVTDAFFGRKRGPKQKNFFLTVTRLDEDDRIKNVHGVIHALSDLKHDYDFCYRVVAGSVTGGYRKELEELIVEKGLAGKVMIEGRKSEEELADYYAKADLFLLVSYAEAKNFEGFGIVFLEANAAGTPVLTSREGGMTDYVREGENGFFVDDPSPAGIRAALKRFLDGDLRFDEDRVRRAPEPYRWTHIADRVLDVYATHGR